MRLLRRLAVAVPLLLGGFTPAGAATITFDDLTTRDNFFALGISTTYQGFEWGYSNSPGPGAAIIPTNIDTGWASATVSSPAVAPAPTPVSGNSYAWNWNGPQSLWIDFLSPHNVGGGYFSTLSSAYGSNASTIQLFGYDAGGNLLGASAILPLTDTFQFLSSGFVGINLLEIRANANAWFSIDNLDVSSGAQQVVPEPSSLLLFGTGAAAMIVAMRRRRKQQIL